MLDSNNSHALRPGRRPLELRRAVLICPAFPQSGGNGLSMRAAFWLRMLSEQYQVSLIVLPVAAGKYSQMSAEYSKLCTEVRVIEPTFGDRIRARIRTTFSNGVSPAERSWLSPSVIHRTTEALAEKSV